MQHMTGTKMQVTYVTVTVLPGIKNCNTQTLTSGRKVPVPLPSPNFHSKKVPSCKVPAIQADLISLGGRLGIRQVGGKAHMARHHTSATCVPPRE